MGRLSLKRGISLVSPTLSSYSPSAFSDSSTYYTPKTPSRFADFQFPNSEQELSRESLTKPLENHSFLTPLSDINKTNNLHSKNQKSSIPSDFCYSLPDSSHISESNLTKYSSVVDIDEANSNQSLVNLPHSSIKKSNSQKSIIKTPKFARKGSQEATEISNSKSIKLDSDGVLVKTPTHTKISKAKLESSVASKMNSNITNISQTNFEKERAFNTTNSSRSAHNKTSRLSFHGNFNLNSTKTPSWAGNSGSFSTENFSSTQLQKSFAPTKIRRGSITKSTPNKYAAHLNLPASL